MRYILILVLACISLCYTYETVNAEKARYPFSKGGFNVNAAATWGNEVFTGQVFFVDSGDSNARDDTAHGMKRAPYATMDFADGLCTANNGDLVVVLPGHTETITAAAGLDLNTAGVTWRAIGRGSDRPTIQFTTATTADMNADGANITMINFLFEARVAGLVAPIDVNAADFSLFNCESRDISSTSVSADGVGGVATDWIQTDANADRLLVDGLRHIGTQTPVGAEATKPVSCVNLVGGDDIIIKNFDIYGNFAGAPVFGTTTPQVRLKVQNGITWNNHATDSAVTVRVDSTGFIGPDLKAALQDDADNVTEAFAGASMYFMPPLKVVNTEGEQATDSAITFTQN